MDALTHVADYVYDSEDDVLLITGSPTLRGQPVTIKEEELDDRANLRLEVPEPVSPVNLSLPPISFQGLPAHGWKIEMFVTPIPFGDQVPMRRRNSNARGQNSAYRASHGHGNDSAGQGEKRNVQVQKLELEPEPATSSRKRKAATPRRDHERRVVHNLLTPTSSPERDAGLGVGLGGSMKRFGKTRARSATGTGNSSPRPRSSQKAALSLTLGKQKQSASMSLETCQRTPPSSHEKISNQVLGEDELDPIQLIPDPGVQLSSTLQLRQEPLYLEERAVTCRENLPKENRDTRIWTGHIDTYEPSPTSPLPGPSTLTARIHTNMNTNAVTRISSISKHLNEEGRESVFDPRRRRCTTVCETPEAWCTGDADLDWD